ncbi:MAG TPA: hypothetical protein VLJ39_07670, partial [Tepidisphaeraceae bacterium]|nr:hypothetical protein [Tepidisphaeraceae bacterium]
MTLETPSIERPVNPDIHIWMTPEDAAQTLATPVSVIDRQLDEGDLDSRVTRDGVLEVLICLPKKRIPLANPTMQVVNVPARVPRHHDVMPIARAFNWTNQEQVERAYRSSRRAWTVAAAMLLVAGATAYVGRVTAPAAEVLPQPLAAVTPSPIVPDLSEPLAQTSKELSQVSADRDHLRDVLDQAQKTLEKTKEELAVDRNVEDQLIKAALANHAARSGKQV